MHSKSPILMLIAVLALLTPSIQAEERSPQVYEGEVAGVICSACAAKVKSALGKLDGVTGVKITAGDKPGVQKIHLTSASNALTKEQAIKSLGDAAQQYHILSLKPAKK